jgi:hypothetical protein
MSRTQLAHIAIRSLSRIAPSLGAAAAASGEPAPLLALEKVSQTADE